MRLRSRVGAAHHCSKNASSTLNAALRVLCVDDNQDIADLVAMLLRAFGFDARACYDGPSALKLAMDFRPSVCVLDFNMPGMAGDELAVKLMAQPDWRPDLLVALTAMSDDAHRERTTAAGFHAHLVKPVDLEELLALVREAQTG
jgi:two-component system OmpR family response regulator